MSRFQVLIAVLLKLKSSGIWHCVTGWIVSDIWKDYGAFIFHGQGVQEECKHDPNFKDTIIIQNLQNNSPSDTVLYPGRRVFNWQCHWAKHFLLSLYHLHHHLGILLDCPVSWISYTTSWHWSSYYNTHFITCGNTLEIKSVNHSFSIEIAFIDNFSVLFICPDIKKYNVYGKYYRKQF